MEKDDDIVVQLGQHEMGLGPGTCQDCYSSTMDRAADEIRRLRAVLEHIIMLDPTAPIGDPPDPHFFIRQAQQIAQRALGRVRPTRKCSNDEICTEPFSWDDGVPYCDTCGMYRSNENRRS